MALTDITQKEVAEELKSDAKLLITQTETVDGEEKTVLRRLAVADLVDDTLTEDGVPADSGAVKRALNNKADTDVMTSVKGDLAPAYSASATYAVGAYVMYNNVLYRCTTAITTAEAWTAAHWTAVNVGGELTHYKEDISELTDNTIDQSSQLINVSTSVTGVVVDGGSISTEGAWANYKTSDYIPVEAGKTYTFYLIKSDNTQPVAAYRLIYGLYDTSKAFIANSYFNTDNLNTTTITPSADGFVRVSCGDVSGQQYAFSRMAMLIEGTTIVPYEEYHYTVIVKLSNDIHLNDTQIEEAVTASRSDMSELYGSDAPDTDLTWIEGEYISYADGSVQENSTYHRTDYVAFDGLNYDLVLTTSNAGSWSVIYNAWYDSQKRFISSFDYPVDTTGTIIPPISARYFRISTKNSVNLTANYAFKKSITGENLAAQEQTKNLTHELFRYNLFDGIFQQGLYASATGQYNPDRQDYVCSKNFMPVENMETIFVSGNLSGVSECYIACYDENYNHLGSNSLSSVLQNTILASTKHRTPAMTNARYINISLKGRNGNISPETAPTDVNVFVNRGGVSTEDIVKTSLAIQCVGILNFQKYIYLWGSGFCDISETRIGIVEPLIAKRDLIVSVDTNYSFSVQTFTSKTLSLQTEKATSWWRTDPYVIPKGEIFLINVRREDDSASIAPEDGIHLSVEPYNPSENSTNYAVGSDLHKQPIIAVEVGELTYLQAFCVYDGKYYSINGTNIAEQGADFGVLRNVTLNTGHGNSLQIGSNGVAYASGWDDNKVYAVNLSTLTIDSVITLPTTGYTTAAIDDVNGIAYIFQRNSYPDTETRYNFIVYDYVHEQIKSTREIMAFAAMQACDLYHDRIIALNGLGTNTAPNGCRVFDLSGNILAEYVFSDFASTEPEGVCIDRETHDLYISLVNKKIYKIK